TEFPVEDHPVVSLQETKVQYSISKEISIARSYAPKINILVGTSLRGSSINSQGMINESSSKGLIPARSNYEVVVSISFPLMDYFQLRAGEKMQSYNTEKEIAVYDQIYIDLISKIEQAKTEVQTALEISKQTPFQFKYAKDTEQQIMARYQSGLVNIVDV